MPTKPLETVIYRELQIARANKFLSVATPLFQELVNYGSTALVRCATSSKRGENEDLAVLNLYRQILEFTDAFEVLIAGSCAWPTIPILRSSFEALLSLQYILESQTNYVQRSLSWLAGYTLNRIAIYEMMLEESDRGKEFRASVEKDRWIPELPVLPQDRVQSGLENLRNLLDRSQFSEIMNEYRAFDKSPRWYQLFGGPSNIQQLAYRLGYHAHYDYLYRQWSRVAHAQDFSQFLAVSSVGVGGIRGIRDPSQLQTVSRFAATFMLEATRRMIQEFRPGENIATYYKREVRPLFMQLISRMDFFS